MMHTKRTDFLGVEFDALSLSQVLRRLEQVTSDSPYAYCITPNVDHIVRLEAKQENGDGLRNVYREADLCVCDSRVLSALARQHRIRLPVVPGSDLTGLLFKDIIRPGDRFLLCSDGLTRAVPDDRICALMEGPDLDGIVEGLIDATLNAGAPDNVTVLVVEASRSEPPTFDLGI